MTYIHPGKLFLKKHGQVSALDDILSYAEFLRKETNLDGQLPVDLQVIVRHFEINPQEASIPVSGMLVDAEFGLIFINEDDIKTRQKFTLAHELVELLFDALPQDKHWAGNWYLPRPGGFKETTKEFYCNWCGANLLMPPTHVQGLIETHGISFDCARILAQSCGVSLSAALVQLTRISQRRYSVVLWRKKNKPTELANKKSTAQLAMFPFDNDLPPQKLRVEWSFGSTNSLYIPKDKSTEKTSFIHLALETGKFTSGNERMTFDNRTSHWYYSENLPQECKGGEICVLSLLELLHE